MPIHVLSICHELPFQLLNNLTWIELLNEWKFWGNSSCHSLVNPIHNVHKFSQAQQHQYCIRLGRLTPFVVVCNSLLLYFVLKKEVVSYYWFCLSHFVSIDKTLITDLARMGMVSWISIKFNIHYNDFNDFLKHSDHI